MKIESAVISGVGRMRSNNEDNYFLNGIFCEDISENYRQALGKRWGWTFLFSVCDGMEDCHGGIASKCAVAALKSFGRKEWSTKALGEFLVEAENAMQERLPEEGGHMGASIVILMLEGNAAYAANLGDSRLYLFREGKLVQLSKDQKVQDLVVPGPLQGQGAGIQTGEHLLHYLGTKSESSAEDFYQIEPFWLKKGDIFLLCSDGLTDMLTDEEIASYMKTYRRHSVKKISEVLYREAMQAGGRDNVTCVTVKVKKLDNQKDIDNMMKIFGIGM